MDYSVSHQIVPDGNRILCAIRVRQKFHQPVQCRNVARVGWIERGQRFRPEFDRRVGPLRPHQKRQVLNRPVSTLRNRGKNFPGIVCLQMPAEIENGCRVETERLEVQSALDHRPALVRLIGAVVEIRQRPGGLELMVDLRRANQISLRFGSVAPEFLAQPQSHQHAGIEGIELRSSPQIVVDRGRRVSRIALRDSNARQQSAIVRGVLRSLLQRIERTGAGNPVGNGDSHGPPGGECATNDEQNTNDNARQPFECTAGGLAAGALCPVPHHPRSNNRMLFFLRKLIEALLLPIGISGLLTIAGVVLRRRWIAVVGVVTLYAFSTQTVSRLMIWPARAVLQADDSGGSPERRRHRGFERCHYQGRNRTGRAVGRERKSLFCRNRSRPRGQSKVHRDFDREPVP